MITYLKTAFAKPKEIYIGRNMKNSHFFYILLLMTGVLTFLSLFRYIPTLQNISQDFNEIKQAVPEFELANDDLESSTESYIYQTDSMIFYFDPEDKMSTEAINETMETLPVPLATGLLNDGMYINLIGQDYFVPYANVENLTTADLEALVARFGEVSAGTILMFIVFLLFYHLFLFVYELIPIALFANIIALFRGVRLRLFQTIKIALLAFIPPILLINILEIFIFPIRYSFEIVLIMSLIVFYRSITEMKNRINEQSDSDE